MIINLGATLIQLGGAFDRLAKPRKSSSVRSNCRGRGRGCSERIARLAALPDTFLIDTQEMAVACLLFTCPNTNLKVPTGVEMDVQGLRAHWKSTLKLDCPHCDDVHDVFVRDVYLNNAMEDLDLPRLT